jgi:hypothetical protein
MARHLVKFPILTIPDAGTDSNVVSSPVGFGHAVDLILYTDDEDVTVLVGPDANMAVGDLVPLQVEAAIDFIAPADRGVVIPTSSFKSFAVQADGAVTGNKVYSLVGQMDLAT